MMGSLSINSQQILILCMIILSWKLDNYIPEFKNSNIVDMCSIPGQSLDFHILQPKKKKLPHAPRKMKSKIPYATTKTQCSQINN